MVKVPLRVLRKLPDGTYASYAEETCPGHVAWPPNRKICAWCGIHIDELRPNEEEDDEGSC